MTPRAWWPLALSLAVCGTWAASPSASSATPGGKVTGHVRVTEAGKAAADASGVVVYVVGYATPSPTGPATMAQEGHQFKPQLLPVQLGQSVEFPNLDWDTSHNVFSTDPRFNLGQYRAGRGAAPSYTFEEPGPVEIFCDIHPDMAATILVLTNASFTRSAADGTFAIADVPPGEWDIFAYDRKAVMPERAHVSVTSGGVTSVDFAIDRTRTDFSHLTWSGTSYADRGYSPAAPAPTAPK